MKSDHKRIRILIRPEVKKRIKEYDKSYIIDEIQKNSQFISKIQAAIIPGDTWTIPVQLFYSKYNSIHNKIGKILNIIPSTAVPPGEIHFRNPDGKLVGKIINILVDELKPHGIQRKRTKGWRMPPNTVKGVKNGKHR